MQLIHYLLAIFFTLGSIYGNAVVDSRNAPEKGEALTVEIIGIDKMKFVVKKNVPGVVVGDSISTVDGNTYLVLEAIKVEPEAEITIQLTTKSMLPSRSMSHNWILLKREADPADFDKEAVLAVDNNYIPPHKEHEILANTALAAPSETVSVTFEAPANQGMYDYICSFPGHFANDMRGKLIVQEQL